MDAQDQFGFTPLLVAVMAGNLDVLKFLIEQVENIWNPSLFTPFRVPNLASSTVTAIPPSIGPLFAVKSVLTH